MNSGKLFRTALSALAFFCVAGGVSAKTEKVQSIQGSRLGPLSRMSGVEIPSLHTSSSFIHPFENVVTRARFEQGPQKVHFRAASDLVMRLHQRGGSLVSEEAQKEYEALTLKGNPLGDYLVAVAAYERSTLTRQAAPPLVVSKLKAAAKNGVLEAMEWLAFLSLFRLADVPQDEGFGWADKSAKRGVVLGGHAQVGF